MSAIAVIARADLIERIRHFAFLVIVAAALYAGYLYIPGPHASYSTVTINDHRGWYNAAYVGAAITVLTNSFLSLAGFFFVRGSVRRDCELHVDGIVAASNVKRVRFLLGKWLSNLLVLLAVAAISSLAAIGMQEWHGEDRALDLAAYLLPYLVITVPAMSFVAAIAVVFDVVPILRGIIGGAIYVLVIWMAMLVVPFQASSDGTQRAPLDPLASTAIVQSLYRAEHASFPREKRKIDVSIGGTPAPKDGFTLFRYTGMTWSPALFAERAAWVLISLLFVAASAFAFDGFRGDGFVRTRSSRTIDLSRILPRLPGLRALRAEFALLVNGSSVWWLAGAGLLAVLGALVPQAAAANFVLPIALIWPLERISALGARERQYDVFEILAATPGFTWRNVVTQWIAGSLAATLIASGYLLRMLVAAHFAGALAIVAMISATVALALAFGTIARAPRAFQATYLVLWYLGPIEHLPALDVALLATLHPGITAIVAFVITIAGLAVASAGRARVR